MELVRSENNRGEHKCGRIYIDEAKLAYCKKLYYIYGTVHVKTDEEFIEAVVNKEKNEHILKYLIIQCR